MSERAGGGPALPKSLGRRGLVELESAAIVNLSGLSLVPAVALYGGATGWRRCHGLASAAAPGRAR